MCERNNVIEIENVMFFLLLVRVVVIFMWNFVG